MTGLILAAAFVAAAVALVLLIPEQSTLICPADCPCRRTHPFEDTL